MNWRLLAITLIILGGLGGLVSIIVELAHPGTGIQGLAASILILLAGGILAIAGHVDGHHGDSV